MTRKIGLDVPQPKETCENDKNCPFHGERTVKKRTILAKVIAARLPSNATVEIERRVFVPKYERYAKRRTRIHAHNPACINAHEGDTVIIAETRKMSKTKNFVVIQKVEDVK